MTKKLIFKGSNHYKKVASWVGVMGFTQVFLRSYSSSNHKIFYGNVFLIKPVLFLDYKKSDFFLIFPSQDNWAPQPGQSPDRLGLSTALARFTRKSSIAST